MREGLKGEGAEVEGQPSETGVRSSPPRFPYASACAGRICILRRPLGVCDLLGIHVSRFATTKVAEAEEAWNIIRKAYPFLTSQESVASSRE
jgi:hypothetical protein